MYSHVIHALLVVILSPSVKLLLRWSDMIDGAWDLGDPFLAD
jgi:hypothetical protein